MRRNTSRACGAPMSMNVRGETFNPMPYHCERPMGARPSDTQCRCERSEAIPVRFLASLGMTLRVRLLRSVRSLAMTRVVGLSGQ
jgi:hypothetical protein